MKKRFIIILMIIFAELALITLLALFASKNNPNRVPFIILAGAAVFAVTIVFILVFRPILLKLKMKRILTGGTEATAEVLQDGTQQMAEYLRGVNYRGPEILFPLSVRLFPADGSAPIEAAMKYRLIHAHFLKPGMKVAVRYDPADTGTVCLAESPEELIERNPELKARLGQDKIELLKRLGR